MNYNTPAIIIAYLLDLSFGDPRRMPHPVKWIGWLITKMEPLFRNIIKNGRVAGMLFMVSIVGITAGSVFFAVNSTFSINRILGTVIVVFFIYCALSIKDLRDESMAVHEALEKNDLPLARQRLALIVGRDTHNLTEVEIVRATVETIAENCVDGIISPLFYAFIGGAPLAMAFKAVNTLDSMVGYKNEKYKDFGWASARFDDLVNFIPARLSAPLIAIAAWIAGSDGANCWKIVCRDGKKNPSPNSGIPEAAVAGALGIQLGGLNYYHSKPYVKPVIGDNIHPLDRRHIKESIRVVYVCSGLTLATGLLLVWIFK